MNVFGPGEPIRIRRTKFPLALPEIRGLRRSNGKEALAVSRHSASWRAGKRTVGRRQLETGRQQFVDLCHDHRRTTRHRLHAHGGPAANYYGGDRKGNNLYANTVVAVDLKSGKLLWHFQTVHHELWDYDLPPSPVLVDIVKDGRKIPALVQTGKSGYMFILDRVTGKPVFGVEERPVPQGNVPGEWYSPTQRFH